MTTTTTTNDDDARAAARAQRDAEALKLAETCKAMGISPARALAISVHALAAEDAGETISTLRRLADALELLHSTPVEVVH